MTLRWDEWTLDVPSRRLARSGENVHVEPQVFDVLAHLVAARDRVVSKSELFDVVWGTDYVSESALTSRIKSARRALGDDGRTQRYIRNVHGRGYQFVGDVTDPDPPTRPGVDVRVAVSIAVDDEFPFVGRHDELDRIGSVATAGAARLVLLGGQPGTGKSRLAVESLRREAVRGVRVCAGRCEQQVSFAMQPIRDAVAQLAAASPDAAASWCAGVEAVIASLVPALASLLGPDADRGDAAAADGYSAMEALSAVIGRAVDSGPVMMLVDDVQWSDEPTLALISRLMRRLSDRPLTVICTFRSSSPDVSPELAWWVGEGIRGDHTLRIDLDGLDAMSARQLVTGVVGAGHTAEVETVLQHAAGNPLLLTESVRDVQRGRPLGTSVQALVGARFDRLADDVKQMVRGAALLGAEFAFELAAAAAGLSSADALVAIDRALDAELLHTTSSPDRFRFSHQLIPETIRAGMSRPAAAAFHHRCVEHLVARDADAVDVAHHLLGAVPLVPTGVAVERSRAAAAGAVMDHEFDRAIGLLDAALSIGGLGDRMRADVLLQAGWALVAAGRPAPAAPSFEEAAELARRHGWADVLVDAALGHFGRSPYRKLLDASTLALLAEADQALGDVAGPLKARLLAKTAVFAQFKLPLSTCDEMTRTALDMVPDAAPLDRLELLESRAIVFSCPAGIAELESLEHELEVLRTEHDIYFADAAAPETALLMRGSGAALRRAARSDEQRIRKQPIAEWRDLALTGTLAAFAGDVGTARARYEEAGAIGDRFWGDSAHVLHGLGHVFLGALGWGWERALELFDILLSFDRNQHLVASAAWAHLAHGDRRQGLALAASIRAGSLHWHGEHILGGNTLIAVAEVAMLSGDEALAAAAEHHLRPFEDLMLGLPWAPSLAAADSLARLAVRRGDPVESARQLALALRVYRGLDAPSLLDRLDRAG